MGKIGKWLRGEPWKALDCLREGGTLVVPRQTGSTRSLQDLIAIASGLRKRGIGFTSLHEWLDTTTPGGRLVFHVFAAPAEFIRELIVQGTDKGLDSTRARDARPGRPRSHSPTIHCNAHPADVALPTRVTATISLL
ncbi:recombinase family protein [Streptomyces sp. NPDC085481]|uniref:recombinase family protein n=1 Tax=Streptomyces sp. NPDC085481 TaxID=3365727 RepID=UPI0037D77FD9